MDDADRKNGSSDTNPFVAFRRFADEQMASIVNSVFGAFHGSPMRRQEAIEQYESWLQNARGDSDERRQRENEEARRIAAIFSRASQEEREHADGSARRSADNDDQDDSSVCPFKRWQDSQPPPEPERPLPTARELTSSLYGLTDSPESPYNRDYLLWSPYSPVILEQDRLCKDQGSSWRAAFEDLIYAQAGQDLPEKHRLADATFTGARSWAGSMEYEFVEQSRKSMARRIAEAGNPSSWDRPTPLSSQSFRDIEKYLETEGEHENKYLTCLSTRLQSICSNLDSEEERNNCLQHWGSKILAASKDDEQEDEIREDEKPEHDEVAGQNTAATELDAYTSLSTASVSSNATASKSTNEGVSKPSILSTLTTTETRTLPDGTSTTRIVLKKRFSDGVEESTEKTFVQNPVPSRPEADQKPVAAQAPAKPTTGKRGWFW